MTLAVLALGWTAVAMVSGLLFGSLIHRFGDGLRPSWDLPCTLGEHAVAAIGSHAAARPRIAR